MTQPNPHLLSAARLMTASLALNTTLPDIRRLFAAASGIDWLVLAHHADGHSLTPLLYDVWQRADVLPYLPAGIARHMSQAFADNDHRNDFIREEVREIHELLAQAGVAHLVLKGWPLVEQLYTRPAHRVLYDHDVLVHVDQASAGYAALQAAGFRPLAGQEDRWVEKHLPPLWRNDGYPWDGYLFDPIYPRPVELHLSLWEESWRGLRVTALPDLWAHTRTRLVAGAPMELLSVENTLLHLAMHFAGHLVEREARLNQLLDLALFLNLEAAHFNWEAVMAQAEASGIGRFVYTSMELAHRIFDAPLPPPAIWQQLAEATPARFRAWLAAAGPTDVLTADYRRRERGRDYHLTFLAAESFAERAGIVRFALFPPVGHLRQKYRLHHRWQTPLVYPRHLLERLMAYGTAMFFR
jgi:hypothetical protein